MREEYHFKKLTPIDHMELGAYEAAMEYVFANDDITNIAISGAYGAGKSSMLKTYKCRNPGKKFMHISLAHFENRQQEEAPATEFNLEGHVLNQLIHQIPPGEIEQTSFHIKKDCAPRTVNAIAAVSILFVLCILFLCFKGIWDEMVNGFASERMRMLFGFTATREAELAVGCAALILFVIGAYHIIRAQKNRKLFKKFVVQGNEIEIFEETTDSYFDKYLNEVLYLFEHCNVDGIVFEDIDRHKTSLIFEKLRNINGLLNRRRELGISSTNKPVEKPIRFFYMVRDDIFVAKDRTKFFDFVLPIVPIVNNVNSCDMLLRHFSAAGLLDKLDGQFIKEMSLYLDDMRIVNNIYNEFRIYYEQFGESLNLNFDKLLAMIVYKNIFPEDFGELQASRGYVHTLFAGEKQKLVYRERKKLRLNIKELQEENARIEAEALEDMDELNAVYFVINGRIRADGMEEDQYASRKDFVKALLAGKQAERFSIGADGYGRWDIISVQKERTAMEEKPEYIAKKAVIKEKQGRREIKNNYRIKFLTDRLSNVEEEYLKELITEENEDEVFACKVRNMAGEYMDFTKIQRSVYFPMIRYLVRNGYINEDYLEYTTYFYGGSINRRDKAFIRGVTDKRQKDYEYSLDDPKQVVEHLRLVSFGYESILNLQLVDFLLENIAVYRRQVNNLLKGIWNWKPAAFVALYLQKGAAVRRFVMELNKAQPHMIHWILNSDELAVDAKRIYAQASLAGSAPETLRAEHGDEEIRDFAVRDKDFLTAERVSAQELLKGLDKVPIMFEAVNEQNADSRLLDHIYSKNRYQLNPGMVELFLHRYYGQEHPEEHWDENLSMIFARPEERLCIYVKASISSYLDVVLEKAVRIRDNAEVIDWVLASKESSPEQKRAYAGRLDGGTKDMDTLNKIHTGQGVAF